MDDEDALRAELVRTCQAMARLGLSRGTSGNVSVRCGADLLISPSGVPYDALRPELVVRVRADGGFAGSVRPSSEWRFHQAILRAKPEMRAVVHTHSVHATAVSVLGRAIPAVHYNIAAAGGGSIPCAPYALFGTEALAEAIVETMRERRACLLAHHGAVAAGVDLAAALGLAEVVEEMATLYLLCLPMGEPPVLSEAQVAAAAAAYVGYGQRPGQRSGQRSGRN